MALANSSAGGSFLLKKCAFRFAAIEGSVGCIFFSPSPAFAATGRSVGPPSDVVRYFVVRILVCFPWIPPAIDLS